MTPTLFVSLFLLFFILEFAINWLLDFLNHQEIKKNPKVPDFFTDSVTEVDYQKSQEYSLVNLRFGKWESLFSAVLSLGILFSGALPWLDNILSHITTNAPFKGVLFFFALFGITGLLKYPLGLYNTFGIEARFGFNKSTVKLYLIDTLKTVLLSVILGGPLLFAVLWFINFSGSLWWLWVFLVMATFQLSMMVLYPIFLAPLFNKFKPLEEGELKTQLLGLAKKINFPNRDIYVMDGSSRSAHSNAYFTGFGRFRRIVLFDTLISQMNVEELKGVLCHEMGHFKKGHIYIMLFTSMLIQFAGLYLFSQMINWQPMYTGFGFTANPLELRHVGLFLMMTVISTFTFLLGPVLNYRSRVHEFEADAFAIDNIENKRSLESALIKLARENLSNLTPHSWYSAFHYSHPTIYERVKALRARLA